MTIPFALRTHVLELPVSINNVSDNIIRKDPRMSPEGEKKMKPTFRGGTAHPYRCRLRHGHIG